MCSWQHLPAISPLAIVPHPYRALHCASDAPDLERLGTIGLQCLGVIGYSMARVLLWERCPHGYARASLCYVCEATRPFAGRNRQVPERPFVDPLRVAGALIAKGMPLEHLTTVLRIIAGESHAVVRKLVARLGLDPPA